MRMTWAIIGLGCFLLLLTVSVPVLASLVQPYSSNSLEVTSPALTKKAGGVAYAQRLRSLPTGYRYINQKTALNEVTGSVGTTITLVFPGKLINPDGTWMKTWWDVPASDCCTFGSVMPYAIFKAPQVFDLYSMTVTPTSTGVKTFQIHLKRNTGVTTPADAHTESLVNMATTLYQVQLFYTVTVKLTVT